VKSVWELGNAIGAYDTNAVCLDIIMGSVVNTRHWSSKGNIDLGELAQKTTLSRYAAVNAWIDNWNSGTSSSYELSIAGGDATRAVDKNLKTSLIQVLCS